MNRTDGNSRQADVPHRYLTRRRVLQLIALALAIAAGIVLLLFPSYDVSSVSSSGATTTSTATLVDVNGPSILLVLAIPVALTAIPLAAAGRAWLPISAISTLLLAAFTVLGLLSIGIFYIPATILAMIATISPDRHRNTGRIIP